MQAKPDSDEKANESAKTAENQAKDKSPSLAASRLPKTDARYWQSKLIRRGGSPEFSVRIRFAGQPHTWPLKTANTAQAAAKARDLWRCLQTEGFAAAQAKFKPWTVAQPQADPASVTVGEYLAAVRAVATVRPTTLNTYGRKLHFLVAAIGKVKGSKSRHDYVHGGADEWRQRVDAVTLDTLTPQAILQWRTRYIGKHDAEPLKRASAQQTAASIIRCAKALFSPKVTRNLGLALPDPLPFSGVDVGKRARTRYQSKVNPALLATQANAELREGQPELYKIFLLALGAGLRRSEIDRLEWKQFNWQRGTLSIEATEYGTTKTESSAEEIDLGADMVAYFKAEMPKATSSFVIQSKAADTAAPHWNRYRADGHFKAMLAWLRSKGVMARTPLHTLRKEFGSLINQQFGIFAASAALRHSNITITREAYVDRKERIALNLGDLMAKEAAAQTAEAATATTA
jgi:integrase